MPLRTSNVTQPYVTGPSSASYIASATILVGSSLTNEVTKHETGVYVPLPIPPSLGPGNWGIDHIFLQARQSVNEDFGYPDEFALQVIQTYLDTVTFRVKRLDGNGGWGQDLQVDILIVLSFYPLIP